VITPADPNQTDHIVRYVLSHPGNFAVIMGRSKIPTVTTQNGQPYFGADYKYRYGRMETVSKGEKLALVAAGNMLSNAMKAWSILAEQNINVSLVSVSDWSDFHADDLAALAGYDRLVTLEDHNVKTGLGVALGAAMADSGQAVSITKLGVGNYASSGTPDQLYKMLGLDADSVAASVKSLLI
jgi:transketolase